MAKIREDLLNVNQYLMGIRVPFLTEPLRVRKLLLSFTHPIDILHDFSFAMQISLVIIQCDKNERICQLDEVSD